ALEHVVAVGPAVAGEPPGPPAQEREDRQEVVVAGHVRSLPRPCRSTRPGPRAGPPRAPPGAASPAAPPARARRTAGAPAGSKASRGRARTGPPGARRGSPG